MSLSKRRERLVRRLLRRSTREREGHFLVEGIRGARDALERGGMPSFAICSPRLRSLTDGEWLATALETSGVDTSWVDDAALESLSDTEAPQGVLLVCEEPHLTLDDILGRASSGTLLLDGVQDPGNVGTLVRAAAAFDVGGVVALDGTVDPWNPKAVRAAAGAVFSVPVARTTWEEVAFHVESSGLALLASDADGADVATCDPPPPWALAVGNEGRGVRAEVRSSARATVGIPLRAGADSLNVGVAGAILLYVLTRTPPGPARPRPLVEID